MVYAPTQSGMQGWLSVPAPSPWARATSNVVVATAGAELAGTSGIPGYGPSTYSVGAGQDIGQLHLQRWAGVQIPIHAANDPDLVFVPLRSLSADTVVTAVAGGSYLTDQARAQSLGSDQWGMMNESGNYPGQPWLCGYTPLVPGVTVVDLRERRCVDLGFDGHDQPRPDSAAMDPRTPQGPPRTRVHRLIWRGAQAAKPSRQRNARSSSRQE